MVVESGEIPDPEQNPQEFKQWAKHTAVNCKPADEKKSVQKCEPQIEREHGEFEPLFQDNEITLEKKNGHWDATHGARDMTPKKQWLLDAATQLSDPTEHEVTIKDMDL